MDIDPLTGLPKDLGAFKEINKKNKIITVTTAKKKFGKKYTIIEGLEDKGIDVKEIAKTLKNKFACGGTYKEGRIELQGDYKNKVKPILVELGFNKENILIE